MIIDRSVEFQEAVRAKDVNYPPKRPRKQFGANRQQSSSGAAQLDPWTKQAEQVAANLQSFSTFINSIRRAYLDLSSNNTSTASRGTLDMSKGLKAWEGVRWLSDRERDEIDLEVKAALRRSVDRVRELEAAEKLRIANEARQNPTSSFARFLKFPSAAPPVFDAITSHRAHITLYLNTLLSNVSTLQIKQQEMRVHKQLEKRSTLGGSSLGMEALGKEMAQAAKSNKVLGNGTSSSLKAGEIPSIYQPLPLPADEDSIDAILTPFQIQQFEAEASALLASTNTDLASIRTAETSLLEISALQSQLAQHLMTQSELTDKLWEDAVNVTGKVAEGNVELKKARERNREGRVWLLIFLIGASMSLLFLDYYT